MFKFWLRFNRFPAMAAVVLTGLIASMVCANTTVAQTPQGFPFRATYYEVEVLLHPEDQTISAQAKVELIALQPGAHGGGGAASGFAREFGEAVERRHTGI